MPLRLRVVDTDDRQTSVTDQAQEEYGISHTLAVFAFLSMYAYSF